MITLRKETLHQKKGRGKVSSERRPMMEKELDLLNNLVTKDKSSISQRPYKLRRRKPNFSKDGPSSFFKGGR